MIIIDGGQNGSVHLYCYCEGINESRTKCRLGTAMAIRSYFEMTHFRYENENTDFIEFDFLESLNVRKKYVGR